MFRFSPASKARLATCDKRIQIVMNSVIKEYDITIVCGYRNKKDQMAAYHSRPQRSKAKWLESPHNHSPSFGIDIAPWTDGIDWDNEMEFGYMAGVIMSMAKTCGVSLVWGGRFKSIDDPGHFEIKDWRNEI